MEEHSKEQRRRRKRRRSPEGISLKTEPRVHEFTAENVEDILRIERLEPINILSALVWNQSSRRRIIRPNVRSCQMFYTDNPEVESEEEEEEEVEEGRQCELHEESLDIIRRAPLWTSRGPEVVWHIPDSEQSDHAHQVSSALGFEFPPVMGQYVETVVHEHWEQWRRQGLIDGDGELEQKFHSIVVEAQIYLAKLITAYIRRRSSSEDARRTSEDARGTSEDARGTSEDARGTPEDAMRSWRGGAHIDLKIAAEKVLNKEDDDRSEVETPPSSPSTGHSDGSPTSPAMQSDIDSDIGSDIDSDTESKSDGECDSPLGQQCTLDDGHQYTNSET